MERKKSDGEFEAIAGLCIESKLSLLTNRKKDFAGVKGLQTLSTQMIVKEQL